MGVFYLLAFFVLWRFLPKILLLSSSLFGLKNVGCDCTPFAAFTDQPFLSLFVLVSVCLSIIFFSRSGFHALFLWLETRRFLRLVSGDKIRQKQLLNFGSVDFITSPLPLAFTYGLWRPHIIISHSLQDFLFRDELKAVMVHERYHCKNYDPVKIFLAQWCGRILGFIPGMNLLVQQYLASTEVAADEAVIQAMGQKRSLASALSKLLEFRLTYGIKSADAIPFFGATEARIDHLLRDSGTSSPENWRFTPLPLSVLFISFFISMVSIVFVRSSLLKNFDPTSCVIQRENPEVCLPVRETALRKQCEMSVGAQTPICQ